VIEKHLCSEGMLHNLSVVNIFTKSEEFIKLIGKKRTHVLITHESIIDVVMDFNNKMSSGSQVDLHKSLNSYYTLAEAMIYRRNLPKQIIQIYKTM